MTFLILEGPDGGGKTTLCSRLAEYFTAKTAHHGPGKGMDNQALAVSYVLSMRPALGGDSLVLDRSWLSEPIYSEVFRKIPTRIPPVYQHLLERVAVQAEAIVINCLPSVETCLKAFESGREEMLKNRNQLIEVYGRYVNLQQQTDLPVVRWDYPRQSFGSLLDELGSVEHETYHHTPRVVIVSDRVSPRPASQEQFAVPFVNFNGKGYAEWIAQHLVEHEIPVTDLYWFNAYMPSGDPKDLGTIPDFPVLKYIAIGSNAARWCEHNNLDHVMIVHPQAHLSFFKDQPYPLGPMLNNIIYGVKK